MSFPWQQRCLLVKPTISSVAVAQKHKLNAYELFLLYVLLVPLFVFFNSQVKAVENDDTGFFTKGTFSIIIGEQASRFSNLTHVYIMRHLFFFVLESGLEDVWRLEGWIGSGEQLFAWNLFYSLAL